MAKSKPKKSNGKASDSTPAPEAVAGVVDVASGPRVQVLAGYDADGLPATTEGVPDEPYDPQFPAREVHIGGQPYVHTCDAPDGSWIYAPRDAKHR